MKSEALLYLGYLSPLIRRRTYGCAERHVELIVQLPLHFARPGVESVPGMSMEANLEAPAHVHATATTITQAHQLQARIRTKY